MKNTLNDYKQEFQTELHSILAFWDKYMLDPQGGFYGQMDGKGRLIPDAPRGAILNARILWTFSSAYRVTAEKRYLELATVARDYIIAHFIDNEFGGLYWSLNSDGTPLDTKKQYYAIAFAVYGLAEYHRACGDAASLELAKQLFFSIEDHSRDLEKRGYIEAATRCWEPIQDMRLSEKDRNDAKTMNTHLHILEAYTGLYRVWKDAALEEALRSLILVFLDYIVGTDGHLQLFFDMDWKLQDEMKSYGHDIEASWLLCEAAEVLGDAELLERTKKACVSVADASLEGFSEETSMIYEFDPVSGHKDADRHWWVQAETVVGSRNMYQLTGDAKWVEVEKSAWNFIKEHLICPDGEWYWSLREDGSTNTADDRAGFWKCPYHNGRMCMEMIERLENE